MGGIPLGVVLLTFSDAERPELPASFQDAASDLEEERAALNYHRRFRAGVTVSPITRREWGK